MQFYRATIVMKHKEMDKTYSRMQRESGEELSVDCEDYSMKVLEDIGYMFVSSATECTTKICFISRKAIEVSAVRKYVEDFFNLNMVKYVKLDIKETTYEEFMRMIRMAERYNYVDDVENLLDNFKIGDLYFRRGRVDINERMIIDESKKLIINTAKQQFTRESLIEEINRIYMGSEMRNIFGHPVHYMIESDDINTKKESVRVLSNALYKVGRVKNRRVSEIDIMANCHCSLKSIRALYECSVEGIVIWNVFTDEYSDTDVEIGDIEVLEFFCSIAKEYKMNVLTMICLPRQCRKIKKKIYDFWENGTFVEIKDCAMKTSQVKKCLGQKAKECGLEPDENLYKPLSDNKKYYIKEINDIFDDWFSNKLKTGIYSQYSHIESIKKKIASEDVNGKAYKELNEMIGLSSAKQVINQVLDSYKAMKVFKSKGICQDVSSRHMIFTGNPGTAKTTVARLFAQILRDNEILETGQFIEVGRSDLVGKYVGWTAPTIKKKFKQAKGGVLFIDEAYSLVDDRSGSFGDEAINTIVQEMENNREDVIVIFAGYPNEMEKFIQKNPGLRSRIAHHVKFNDYTAEELCDIARLIVKNKNMRITDGAMDKIHMIMETAVSNSDFGNGRFVRNIIEKARLAQSSRLIKLDYEKVTADDVATITVDDIEIPVIDKMSVKKIGFCA